MLTLPTYFIFSLSVYVYQVVFQVEGFNFILFWAFLVVSEASVYGRCPWRCLIRQGSYCKVRMVEIIDRIEGVLTLLDYDLTLRSMRFFNSNNRI